MSDVVERLRELLAKATPGPWYTLDPPWLTSGETSILAESPDPHIARFICDFDMWALDDDDDRKSESPDADAALIVAAVNALPDLLAEITRLRAQVASLTAAVEGERRAKTDALYMKAAYRQMLGPKGREVAALWDAQGVVRKHSSWAVDPYSLDGEQIAETHLAFEAAPKTPMGLGELDAAAIREGG